MLFVDSRTNKITLTQGDNATIKVELEERELFNDDTILMTVRDNNDNVVFTKTADNGMIEIEPEDTSNMERGNLYHYDIELTTFSGKVYTIVADAIFSIGREVTV